ARDQPPSREHEPEIHAGRGGHTPNLVRVAEARIGGETADVRSQRSRRPHGDQERQRSDCPLSRLRPPHPHSQRHEARTRRREPPTQLPEPPAKWKGTTNSRSSPPRCRRQ